MLSNIHPFPARMAPDIAEECLGACASGSRVLDPMCGSGTVLRAAVEAGLDCTGIDIDPLAALMSRVWVTPVAPSRITAAADDVVRQARDLPRGQVERAPDHETRRFIAYWFARRQRRQLQRLATVLHALRGRGQPEADALAVVLSRIIISKEMKASLARDTSHGRPHRVADRNDFDVYRGFLAAAAAMAKRLAPELIRGNAEVLEGDARSLEGLDDDAFDLVVTSPPYLNAIDYLRGHKLTLVWLGYDIPVIRETRSISIGAEKAMAACEGQTDVSRYVALTAGSTFASRHLGWVRRYAVDMRAVFGELARVVKEQGRVVIVVGNSFLGGAAVDNASLVRDLAWQSGFQLVKSRRRPIPANRRYLPPPQSGNNMLDARIREETVLELRLLAHA
ncbi:MAG: site-specific DNA-methyltransferase [Chloroflexi bacterium]|nr:site-specific DNA-methyltransferase [Chloroflexota bacterium]